MASDSKANTMEPVILYDSQFEEDQPPLYFGSVTMHGDCVVCGASVGINTSIACSELVYKAMRDLPVPQYHVCREHEGKVPKSLAAFALSTHGWYIENTWQEREIKILRSNGAEQKAWVAGLVSSSKVPWKVKVLLDARDKCATVEDMVKCAASYSAVKNIPLEDIVKLNPNLPQLGITKYLA